MHRICFYSDDSYGACGNKRHHVVVAGIALMADRTNVNRALLEAEKKSKKGIMDWHSAPPRVREAYLEEVLAIEAIRGRVFYHPFDALLAKDYWRARVTALSAAINRYTPGDCQHRMLPEGLKSNPRHQLRTDLKKCGCERVTVESAQLIMDPEVRLADALAGYVRVELYRDGERAVLHNLPDWFLSLEP